VKTTDHWNCLEFTSKQAGIKHITVMVIGVDWRGQWKYRIRYRTSQFPKKVIYVYQLYT